MSETYSGVATCPVGLVVYGGGGTIVEGTSDAVIGTVSTYPSSTTAWTFTAEVTFDSDVGGNDANDDVTVTAYALCGNP